MRGHRAYLDQPDNWTNRGFYVPKAKPNAGQVARARGPILPMAYDHPTLSQRLSKWWGGRHE